MKEGTLPGMMEKAARIRRVLRRTYHQRTGASHLDLGQIEHRIITSLYRKTATELGLQAYEMGRALCIEGRGKRFRIWQCTTELDTFPCAVITEDKVLTKALFKERGIPVPEGRAFDWSDESSGIEYALSLGRPCVLKPASDTSSGKGVAARLTTRREITRAFRFAGLFSPQVLIEEFIEGENYRFLIYMGKCLSVLRRELPQVTGNGTSTVRELVEAENRSRIQTSDWHDGDPYLMPLPMNAGALRILREQGLDWRRVPKAGQQVHLAAESSYGLGCAYTEVIGKTHPDQLKSAEEAAQCMGVKLAGLDIISPDIEASAHSVLEINISPGIEIHSMVGNPEQMTHPIRTILKDYFEIGS
jgi:cyanophycin synthetase